MTIQCKKCGKEKGLDEFYRYSNHYGKGVRKTCKVCFKIESSVAIKKRIAKNPKGFYKKQRAYRHKNIERVREICRLSEKRRNYRDRRNVVEYYGGNPPKCKCCGESIYEFLAIDHINGGGSKHRKELGLWGVKFFRWLLKNNFPRGFQILCHNCNMAKGFYGRCPHQEVADIVENKVN